MRKNFSLILLVIGMIFNCEKDPILGCTDSQALNKDFGAEENDGSCLYSNVSFYASAAFYNTIPITKIVIMVDGSEIGSLNGTIYPTGPGNCSAPGNVPYTFTNGDAVDWNTNIQLANGATIFTSGQIAPSRSSECIRLNVTR